MQDDEVRGLVADQARRIVELENELGRANAELERCAARGGERDDAVAQIASGLDYIKRIYGPASPVSSFSPLPRELLDEPLPAAVAQAIQENGIVGRRARRSIHILEGKHVDLTVRVRRLEQDLKRLAVEVQKAAGQ